MKPAMLSDGELLEAIDLAATRIRLAGADDLRHVGDVLAGLAVEAGARISARGRDVLRDRVSRLEDAAFHFQTCSTCRREGEGACSSGQRFAAYLRGDLEQAPPTAGPPAMVGKVRNVVLSADGTLTCELELTDAGAVFVQRIKKAAL